MQHGLFAAALGCRVRAFEMQTELTKLLSVSVLLNRFGDRMQVVNKALSHVRNGNFSYTPVPGASSLVVLQHRSVLMRV